MARGMRSPVKFNISALIAAGATLDALTGWQYETPDFDAMVEILERATATGLVSSHSSAGDTRQQESPVQAGGAAGTIPSRLNTEPITGHAPQFQKLKSFYRNPTGGGITIDYAIVLTPRGGGGGGGVRRVARFRRRRR